MNSNITNQSTCDTCKSNTCPAKTKRLNESNEEFNERRSLYLSMCKISNKILILSGKGGVGKSTVAVNLAAAWGMQGYKVGLLDADIHGPSIPTMLSLQNVKPMQSNNKIIPVKSDNIKVISVGFFIESEATPLIWRGPMKTGIIKQFLKDVEWGELDFLVVDLPPGTGDEALSICQLMQNPTGAVIVATPQKVAASDVKKCISFCRQLQLPILGIIENMNKFICPKCGTQTNIFREGGGKALSQEFGLELLGDIPLYPAISEACDNGAPLVKIDKSVIAEELKNISKKIINACTKKHYIRSQSNKD